MESLFGNIKHISNQKLRQKLPVYKRFLFEKSKKELIKLSVFMEVGVLAKLL
ncbi:MAG: hypothetical protein AABY36_01255 [Campylobacterota bacterium]